MNRGDTKRAIETMAGLQINGSKLCRRPSSNWAHLFRRNVVEQA